jgi:RNA polymerase sigma factor (TIGR02999 family)
MAEAGASDVTLLLANLARGSSSAAEQLFPLVYRELRKIAAVQMRGERNDHTLEPTALVHEAFLRLVGAADLQPSSRAHFFAIAAQAMRRILVDHARRRRAQKRGAGARPTPFTDAANPDANPDSYIVAMNEALDELAVVDPRQARIVELRFFGGMTIEETAALLEVGHATIERDWKLAKAWLHRRIQDGAEG